MFDRKEGVSISDKMAKLIYGDRQLFWGLGFLILGLSALIGSFFRSEERRVGKECRL